jgi:hypothetical protein
MQMIEIMGYLLLPINYEPLTINYQLYLNDF